MFKNSLYFLRTVVSVIDKTLQSLVEQSELHGVFARRVYGELIPLINETYKEIATGKKKYMKILKNDIIKERDRIYQKTKKEVKGVESIDMETLQLSLDMEFEETSMKSIAKSI